MLVLKDKLVSFCIGILFHAKHRLLLQNMGIKDEFHQRSILVCIEELCQSSPPPPVATETAGSLALATTMPTSGVAVESGCSLGVNYPGNNVVNKAHKFTQHSFSVLEKCGKCHKYLRGLLHQGFLCQGTSRFLLYRIEFVKYLKLIEFYNRHEGASFRVRFTQLNLLFVRFLYFS